MNHHPHDGCTGADRPLDSDDHEAIADKMGEMMLACARQDGLGVLRAGAFIGMHYGPGGEWALALRLATQVVGLAPEDHRDEAKVPVLGLALQPKDERVRLVTVHCISLFPETKTHTLDEVDEAIALAVPLVQDFVRHYHHDHKDEARAAWEVMYEMTACDNQPPSRTATLRAGACSALLTCWATRYSALRIGT